MTRRSRNLAVLLWIALLVGNGVMLFPAWGLLSWLAPWHAPLSRVWPLYGLVAVPALGMVAAAANLFALARVKRGTLAGLCPRCGYDLRATPDRCPECGTVRADRSHDPHRRHQSNHP